MITADMLTCCNKHEVANVCHFSLHLGTLESHS